MRSGKRDTWGSMRHRVSWKECNSSTRCVSRVGAWVGSIKEGNGQGARGVGVGALGGHGVGHCQHCGHILRAMPLASSA
jgi:hypothetical protein